MLCFALVLPTVLSACTVPDTDGETTTAGGDTTTGTPSGDTTTGEPSGDTTTGEPSGDTTTGEPSGETTGTPSTDTTPSDTVQLDVVWNKGRVKSDFNSQTTGIDESNTDYLYTDVITVAKAGTEIKFTDRNLGTSYNSTANRYDYVISHWKKMGNKWIFDSKGTNISGSNVSGSPIVSITGTTEATTVTYTYVTSKDNENIRLCFKSSGSSAKPKVYMTENAGAGTYNDYLKFLEDSREEVYDENLDGITLALFGDSYLAGNNLRGEYTWASMLADKYDMRLYNHAYGGATISNNNGGYHAMVDNWSKNIGSPDIIVVEGGRNDSNQNSDVFGSIPLGTNTDTTTYTFKGAIMYMIKNLREKYPDAMIIGVTSYNSPDRATTKQYAEAMKEVFDLYGYPCIFAADPEVSGVDTGKQDFRTKYMEHPQDHSHLNYQGHMNALPKFEAAISKCYADFLDGKYEEKALPNVVNGAGSGNSGNSGNAGNSGGSDSSGSGATTPTEGPEVVVWDNAFVGSDVYIEGEDVSKRWKKNPINTVYKASNVITLTKAGTTIVLKEKGVRAANNIFAISSWKQVGGAWEIDKEGINLYASDDSIYKKEGEYNVWTYTSTKDNEHIMLCYKAHASGTPAPTEGPIIEVTGTGKLVITPFTGDVNTTWHTGFVCSDSYKSNVNQRWQLVSGVAKYTYTDIINIPNAGTSVSFTLPSTTPANSDIFAISSWKLEGSTWVIDREGANFAGSATAPSPISMPSGNNIVYTYITSKDNENIRICYRNDTDTNRPAIYLKENAGEGTLEKYNNWMEQSKELFDSENLKDLNVAFFGDSYLAGDGIGYTRTWIGLLGKKYNMTLTNLAIGGSSMSNYGNLSSTNTPLVDRFTDSRYSSVANNLGDVDLIIVEGGRNDSTQDIANGRHPVPLGDGSTADTKTFLGAIRFMYETLHTKYPNATIVFVTCWGVGSGNHTNELGKTTYDYAKAMADFCAANGWYCIDASSAAECGVEINDSEYRKDYSIAGGDWSHLNEFGHRNVMAYYERYLDAIIAEVNNTDATETDVLPVVWNSGWVHSELASEGVPGQIDKNVTTYLYTTVFTVEKAGTTIYFTDLGGTNENVYALSHWKCAEGTQVWELDTSKPNLRYSQFGTADNTAVENVSGGKVYKYTTTEDNEVLRLSVNGAGDPNYIVVRFIEPTT